MSCRIHGGDFDQGGQATRRLKEKLVRLGVSGAVLRRAMIAAYEAEMNVVIHARTGTLWARLGDGRLELEVADEGPGIPDVQLALREGWSTASEKARQLGFGAGLG
ncbi:MAG TPA: ATP-binding protein, partial [Candidatus Baltobacteraceae bacterium]|nr:ATP-binding protein [Candidatus Baltobacteraceae bacterium]